MTWRYFLPGIALRLAVCSFLLIGCSYFSSSQIEQTIKGKASKEKDSLDTCYRKNLKFDLHCVFLTLLRSISVNYFVIPSRLCYPFLSSILLCINTYQSIISAVISSTALGLLYFALGKEINKRRKFESMCIQFVSSVHELC
jgi:hypothetical protein